MLVIRMQRTGRKGHAQFRVVVQDSRRTPTSGKIVAALGAYNPHAKTTTLDKEKAQFFLDHGAQPSPRVARLLKAEGVKLPKWVIVEDEKKREVRNADKRRSTRPPEPVEEAPAEEPTPEAPVEETPAEETATEAPAEEVTEAPVEVPAAETEASEAPAEEAGAEPAEAETPADDETTAE